MESLLVWISRHAQQPVTLAQGATLFIRTYLATGTAYGNRTNYTNNGGKYPNDIVGGGGFLATSDLTAAGSAAIADAESNLFAPMGVYGDTATNFPIIVGSGDSIMAGQGDSNDMGVQINSSNSGGWFERAFSGKRGHVNLSMPGEKAVDFTTPRNHSRRARFITPGSWAICALGRNDILNTVAQIQAAVTAHWKLCAQRGAKVAATTITPETGSTDGWATTTNQAFLDPAREVTRLAVNDWLRAGAPLIGGAPVAVGTAGPSLLGPWAILQVSF